MAPIKQQIRKQQPQNNPKLVQMHLDVGQTGVKGTTRCDTCGYVYTKGVDDQLHNKHHREQETIREKGIYFNHSIKGTGEQQMTFGSMSDIRIFEITKPMITGKMKSKCQEIFDLLGSVFNTSDIQLSNTSKLYLYVVDKRIQGILMCEAIKFANPMIPPKSSLSNDDSSSSSSSSSSSPYHKQKKSRQTTLQFIQSHNPKPVNSNSKPAKLSKLQAPEKIECSSKRVLATMGVKYMWTLKSKRGQGICSTLLDFARAKFALTKINSQQVEKSALAFTQVTRDGWYFATKYTETPEFLTYE